MESARARHIGIAGVTAEGAFLCARAILGEAERRLPAETPPQVTIHLHPTAEYIAAVSRGDWDGVTALLVASIEHLRRAGAEFAIIPANAVHYAFDGVAKAAPIPVLSLVDAVADECRRRSFRRVGVLGVSWTMEGGLYDEPLRRRGIESMIPGPDDRQLVHRIILDELIAFRVREESTARLVGVVERLKVAGCEAVALACTELPLCLNEGNCGVPVLDTTALLADAAFAYSMKKP